MSAPTGLRRYYDVNGWFFVAPALALIAVFMAYPIVWSLWMSFQQGRGMVLSFAGFNNILRLTQDPVF
ncbi:sugar ABC transporter permease, partial [Mycobacterium tuberculosis]|nr:sugar ABC transporter permease [Mycobacterium tuberculosis]